MFNLSQNLERKWQYCSHPGVVRREMVVQTGSHHDHSLQASTELAVEKLQLSAYPRGGKEVQ